MNLDELIHQVTSLHPHGTPLDHVEDACVIAARLDELADHLVGHFVDQARRSGASWTMIGDRMGVTKQAAQQRFVPGEASMERFTPRAKVVVFKAHTEARDRGHSEVTSVHLLLGIVDEWEGLAGQALESAGVSREALRTAAVAALPPSAAPVGGPVGAAPGLKKVHELIVREALRLGHNYIGTEHILLGLLEAGEQEAGASVLDKLGVGKAGVEAWTLQALEELKRKHH
jgi:hypothetical protein